MTSLTATTTRPEKAHSPAFGRLLKEWRLSRGASQLDLAVDCGVSQRHLSFLESGRAQPSRAMVLHLASALAVPLRQQNQMLLAAGFAPAYAERPLDAPDMQDINRALERMLTHQEPYPAVVVDRAYNLLRGNQAATRLLGFLLGARLQAIAAQGINLVDLTLREDALKPVTANWEATAIWLLRRLRAEAIQDGGHRGVDETLARALSHAGVGEMMRDARPEPDNPPVLVVEFAHAGVRLKLFSMIATVGTPLDAALQDLRVEFFFPGDEATGAWFAAAAQQ